MGHWGHAPWENDAAADWLISVFERTRIDALIAAKLDEKIDESNADEIRAAIMLFILLGRNYVYNIETLDDHLQLAIGKAKELKEWYKRAYDDPEFERLLDNELAVLELRKLNAGVNLKEGTKVDPELQEWWLEWLVD